MARPNLHLPPPKCSRVQYIIRVDTSGVIRMHQGKLHSIFAVFSTFAKHKQFWVTEGSPDVPVTETVGAVGWWTSVPSGVLQVQAVRQIYVQGLPARD